MENPVAKEETRLALVFFKRSVSTDCIEKLLADFNGSFKNTMPVFQNNSKAYAIEIRTTNLNAWIQALQDLDEIELVLPINTILFVGL